MWTTDKRMRMLGLVCLAAGLVTANCGSREPEKSGNAGVKVMPAGKEFSGFLTDYANLKPNPNVDGALTYVRQDPVKNIREYVAIIVDPVQVYVATNADPKAIPERGRGAITEYFQGAMERAVEDAFPIVREPGPLVLRLRSALIGVDVSGGNVNVEKGSPMLERAVDIGKVGVELELVDSETGEQIAAAVDRENLGQGAVIGSANFSRDEKFRAATQAFDGWASKLRAFLDAAHEPPAADVARIDGDYRPYGGVNK